jgi:outer membrane receptor protein involved in Fe transport
MENNKSGVGEWNLIIGNTMANSLIVGYGKSDESRKSRGDFFPMVDILQADTTYTAFGFEAFTPNNELRYNTFQLQENFTRFGRTHSLTFGASYEKYRSENVFFPGSQSVYVYNSLADFYTDANGYLQNPNRTTSPVTLRIFQVRYMNIPGLDKPLQPLEVQYTGAYVQDEWSPRSNVKVTAGVRGDVAIFGETGYQNVNADALTFRDETGAGVQYNTAKLPDANILWSPRLGFNWDVFPATATRRSAAASGTGKPAFVDLEPDRQTRACSPVRDAATTARPFSTDPASKPTSDGAPAANTSSR